MGTHSSRVSVSGDAMDFNGSLEVSHAGNGNWLSGQHGTVERAGNERSICRIFWNQLFLAKLALCLFDGLMYLREKIFPILKSYQPKSLCNQESQHTRWRSTQNDQPAGDISHRWEVFKTPLGLNISGPGVLGILWYANVILYDQSENTTTVSKAFIAQRCWMTSVCHPRESLEEQMTELRSCQWQARVQINRSVLLS